MSGTQLLTIVTVVRNDAAALEATLGSLERQTSGGFEHLIIDGASDDETREVLARARSTGAARVVSEPDRGIYDAMNKGWRLARGTYVHYLNAGDVFAGDDEVAWVTGRLTTTRCEWLRTRVRFVDSRGAATRPLGPVAIDRKFWWGWQPVFHQGAFMQRDLIQRLGGFDTGLRIVADYDLMRRALASGCLPVVDPRVTVDVHAYGVSDQRWRQGCLEMHRCRTRGRSLTVRTASAADAGTHIGLVAAKRALRTSGERLLGVDRVGRIRGRGAGGTVTKG